MKNKAYDDWWLRWGPFQKLRSTHRWGWSVLRIRLPEERLAQVQNRFDGWNQS